ncbi:MAG: NAD(P)-dependent oxidoreductase [Gemmatimonadetes bacterium]|nr:NAD(P)-dependent oxidoreductase [Gemmatimonadota bacterium]
MPRFKIVVPDDFPRVLSGSTAEDRLRALGDVTIHSERGADQEVELIRRIGNASIALNIRAHARFSAQVLDACSTLRLISIWGTGTDHVDLDACHARGVTVVGTPGANANAVAEHAIALMLAGLRRIPTLDAELRRGDWARAPIAQLEGKTLGIVGLGAIGRRVAALAAPFGVHLLASTSGPDNGRAAACGAVHVPIEQLLTESDVVSLHLRLDPTTIGYLSRSRLSLMKPTAWLVNTARGALVDRDALLDALQKERIAGAALDVFHEEPLEGADPLRALPNVVLTPHIAGNTPEVIDGGLALAVANIESFLRDRGT